jgi:DNA-binding MarR family transcriptional regulator
MRILRDPVEALDLGLRRLMWIEQKRLSQMLDQHKLTTPQFFALVNLAHQEQGCAMGDLAERLFQSNATMSGIIDRLEAVGLVARQRGGEDDKRKVIVKLTAEGRGLLQRVRMSRRERFRRALANFPARDIKEFVRLLDAYLNELEGES